jgi:DNA-binding MarR family transcriptional regulator
VAAKRKRKDGAEESIGLLLRDFFHTVRAAMEEALKPSGYTPPQFMALMIVEKMPGISGAELARMARITPQAMAELLTGLEKAGLVRRQRHPDNARIYAAHLTAHGEAAHAACESAMRVMRDRMLRLMNDADRKHFARLLAQATAGMKAAPDPSG